MTSPGTELRIAVSAWESALKNIPDGYLSRAYEHAAENWDWVNGKAFSPDAVHQSFTILVVEDRQRAEAEKRNAARRNPDTYHCWHCLDLGYQPLYTYQNKLWYSAQRPCCCMSAPESQRQQFPLDETIWFRNRLGEYARRDELEKYGVPNDAFKEGVKL